MSSLLQAMRLMHGRVGRLGHLHGQAGRKIATERDRTRPWAEVAGS
jgi:hypothetical protein